VLPSIPSEFVAPTFPATSDGPNVAEATCAPSLLDVMGMLQAGRVDVGFLGGAEVDERGNLNTTMVGTTRLPGSGGASDIAAHAKRCMYLMEHERRRLVSRVSYVTTTSSRASLAKVHFGTRTETRQQSEPAASTTAVGFTEITVFSSRSVSSAQRISVPSRPSGPERPFRILSASTAPFTSLRR
jgi:hypothetical protein